LVGTLQEILNSRTKAIINQAQNDIAVQVMHACPVYSLKVTHAGRHAGSQRHTTSAWTLTTSVTSAAR
ncbi:hypothetical protein BGZ54_001684, partial [Gamsiella multidivaricata]